MGVGGHSRPQNKVLADPADPSDKKLDVPEPAPEDVQASESIFGYKTLLKLVQTHRTNVESQDAPRPPPTPPTSNPSAARIGSASSSALKQAAQDAAEVEAIKSLGLNPTEAKALSRVAYEIAAFQQETGRTVKRPDSGVDVQKSKSAADAAREEDWFGAAHGLADVLLKKLQEEAAEQSQRAAVTDGGGMNRGLSPKSNLQPWEDLDADDPKEKTINPDLEMYMSGMAEDWMSKQPTKKNEAEHVLNGQRPSRGSSAGDPDRPLSNQDPALQFVPLLKPNPPGEGEKRMARAPSKETIKNNLRAGNWSARPLKPPTPAQQVDTRTCPSGHVLEKFSTPKDGFTCDVCSSFLAEGSWAYGCRPCDFDVCATCSLKADAAKIHARANTRPGELARKRLKKQQAVAIPPKVPPHSQLRSAISYPDLMMKGASTSPAQGIGLRQAAGFDMRYSSQAPVSPENSHEQARMCVNQAQEVLRDIEERGEQKLTPQQCAEMLSRWAGTAGSTKAPLVPQGGSFNHSRRFVATGAILSSNASPSVSPTGHMRGRLAQSHVSLAEGALLGVAGTSAARLGHEGGRPEATSSRADLALAAVG